MTPEETEPPHNHIVKAYDDEIARLNQLFTEMSGVAEAQLDGALRAVARRDEEMADQIRLGDRRLDTLDTEIDALVVRMLALRQPVANDLRLIIGMLRASSDIERIGDYAKNIAKRVPALVAMPVTPHTRSVIRLGRLVQAMLKDVFDAYADQDIAKAISVWEADEEVDELYTSVFRELLTYMMEDPRYITTCTHMLFIAKNLERIGDHATNIAETLHYQVSGERLDERRSKADELGPDMLDGDSPERAP
ncbi:MAG: phosphate signaling complex protein PhoU [Alphaproteobacteria bacterium]|nr:phosphate signaling complex protein PhoU [Alphaproteobacteria bacterium]